MSYKHTSIRIRINIDIIITTPLSYLYIQYIQYIL